MAALMVELTQEILEEVCLTKTIPVRELRAKGWRTRAVNNFNERGINGASKPAGRILHQTLHHLVLMLMVMLRLGLDPVVFKRDMGKAYRTIPICDKGRSLFMFVLPLVGITWHVGS